MMKIVVNGEPRECPTGVTVAQLLSSLGISPRHTAVEVNMELVPRDDHGFRVLAEGDRMEVVSLVGGG